MNPVEGIIVKRKKKYTSRGMYKSPVKFTKSQQKRDTPPRQPKTQGKEH